MLLMLLLRMLPMLLLMLLFLLLLMLLLLLLLLVSFREAKLAVISEVPSAKVFDEGAAAFGGGGKVTVPVGIGDDVATAVDTAPTDRLAAMAALLQETP